MIIRKRGNAKRFVHGQVFVPIGDLTGNAVPGNDHTITADGPGLQSDEGIDDLEGAGRQITAVAVAVQVVRSKLTGRVVHDREATIDSGVGKERSQRIIFLDVVVDCTGSKKQGKGADCQEPRSHAGRFWQRYEEVEGLRG